MNFLRNFKKVEFVLIYDTKDNKIYFLINFKNEIYILLLLSKKSHIEKKKQERTLRECNFTASNTKHIYIRKQIKLVF